MENQESKQEDDEEKENEDIALSSLYPPAWCTVTPCWICGTTGTLFDSIKYKEREDDSLFVSCIFSQALWRLKS